jgi:ectoine hydroxylase-related dioxygenase (phytanoyl-CoA dioxygenase family)
MESSSIQVDVERYYREGFLTVPSVLDAEQIVTLRAESDRLMNFFYEQRDQYPRRIEWEVDHLAEGDKRGMEKVIRKLEPILDFSPAFKELAFSPRISGPISAIFGEPVDLFEDKLNFKLPGGSPYPWHQDWVCCWRAHTDRLITCFIYLDDADEVNGCLQVVPRSHSNKPILPFREGSRFEVDPAYVDPNQIVAVPLKAGEMIFFDPYLLHYSDLNRGRIPRRAIIYTYYPASLGKINQERFLI